MISDSSPIIIFAKINKLNLLIKLYDKIQITNGIYKEIVEQGLLINASDAKIIKKYIDDKKIEILELNKEYEEFSKELKEIYPQLGIGESDAISLALQKENKTIIIDEHLGRTIAKLYNLKSRGSLRVLIESYKKNNISETELRDTIDEMIKNKFRIGADVITEFWKIFEKLKNERK